MYKTTMLGLWLLVVSAAFANHWQDVILQNVTSTESVRLCDALSSLEGRLRRAGHKSIKFHCYRQRILNEKQRDLKEIRPFHFDNIEAGNVLLFFLRSAGLFKENVKITREGASICLDPDRIYLAVPSEYQSGPLVIYDNFFDPVTSLTKGTFLNGADLMTRISDQTGAVVIIDGTLAPVMSRFRVEMAARLVCAYDLLKSLMEVLSKESGKGLELCAAYTYRRGPTIAPPHATQVPLKIMVKSDDNRRITNPSFYFQGITGKEVAKDLFSGRAFPDWGVEWLQYDEFTQSHIVMAKDAWWTMVRNPTQRNSGSKSNWLIRQKGSLVIVEEN